MRLQQIRLSGFKSFARPVQINLAEGITSVVGPNGSGKSNIVDAILWVFGEQSLKTIRASEKTDIIFSGSDNSAPASHASVALVFAKKDGQTFEVSRSLGRDGKNDYMMDGEKCRRKDILELFAGTGAGKELYSIVSQGRVDKILNSSPEEIRLLIEEAAGIAMYKKKKRETLSRIESTDDNLSRVADILAELDKQRKSLYLKAKRAEKFQQYSEELRQVQVQFFSHLDQKWRKRSDSITEQGQQNREQLKNIQKELMQVESRWRELREEFGETDREMEGFTSVLETYKERQNQLGDLRNIFSKKRSEQENQFVGFSTRLDNANEAIHRYTERKLEIDRIYKTLKQDLEAVEANLEQLLQKKQKFSGEYSDEEKTILALQQEVADAEKALAKLENESIRLEESIEDHEKRIKVISSQLENKQERLEGMETELAELRESGAQTSEKEKELLGDLNGVKEQLGALESQIKQVETTKYDALQQSKHLEAEKAVLERQIRDFAGFSRPVKALFQRKEDDLQLRNMIDVVANLLEVDNDFEKAFEVLLGNRSQNVVTTDTQTARYAVEVLKTNNLGRCTFLPIDELETRPIVQNPQLASHPGFVGYASELVRVDPEFAKIPLYLFRDTIVVHTLDDGLDIKRKFQVRNQVVSLDGQFISSSGAITGGSLQVDVRSSFLARNRRLHEVDQELQAAQKELSRMQKAEKKLLSEKEKGAAFKNSLESELNDIMLKNASIRRTLQQLTTSIDEYSKEVHELQKLKIDYSARIAGAQARKEKAFGETTQLLAQRDQKKSKLENVSDVLREKKNQIQSLQESINTLKLEQNTLKERERQYSDELGDISRNLQQEEENVTVYRKNMAELEKQMEENSAKLTELDQEIDSLKREMASLFEDLKFQQEDRQKKMQQMEDLEKRMEELKGERESLREKEHQLEMQQQEVDFQQQALFEKMTFAGLSNADLVESRLSEAEEKQYAQNVQGLEQKIKYLGNVDLGAIDEYRQIDDRFNEMDEQRKDLESTRASLVEILEKTDSEAKEIFRKTFDEINTNFNEMIQTLFGGGTGELRILPGTDLLESGIEISVKRPGKKFQKMYLLSGGEKSLVGIALVFSMLRISPSPFYILDEVDAALDDFNAERLKNLVVRYKQMAQFIMITHNKLVMEAADILYGITQSMGISMVMSVELEQYAV
ncbi:MAG TPA: chromosome segregation protein SMC [Thermotogota bacterium]|nr:chromosome segregation protein SMC [Thermotogota bacterium]HRW92534.1 chromosome segregation protein SMC [Thermotogota bacterium]